MRASSRQADFLVFSLALALPFSKVSYLRQQFLNVDVVLKDAAKLEDACVEPECSHTHVLDCVAHAR